MAPRIIEEHRKEVNIAVILTALIVLGSFSGILPFDIVSSQFSGVYTIEWAGMECAATGSPGATIFSSPTVQLVAVGNNLHPSYLASSYVCPYIGGCTVEATDIRAGAYGTIDVCYPSSSIVTFNKDQDINSRVIVAPKSSNALCYSITSYRLRVYPTNLHLIKKTSGPAVIPLGWLSNTQNCMLRQASPDLLNELAKAGSFGSSVTLPDGTQVDPYRSSAQILPGETVNYMVDWVLRSTRVYDFNGQKVLCLAKNGLYNIYPTADSDTYIQGNIISGMAGNNICCGQDIENVCGYGYSCVDYRCVEDPQGTKGECDPNTPYISSGSCMLLGGKYTRIAPSTCVNGKTVAGAQSQVACCPNLINSGCPSGYYCGETDYTCHQDIGYQKVAAGGCAGVGGKTISGAEKPEFDATPYEKTPCANEGDTCCYSSPTAKVGSCLTQCTATGQTGKSSVTGETCEYQGILGWWAKTIGMGCDTLSMILAIIVLVILIAIILVIISWVMKLSAHN